jgi:hypothetical protein
MNEDLAKSINLRSIIPDNACILCITVAAGTELADAYSSEGKSMDWPHHLHPVGTTRSPQGRLWHLGVTDRP